MNSRLEFQKKLEAIKGVKKVYFQPPPTICMRYPCIVYHRDGGNTLRADDYPYHFRRRYSVTVIDSNPDSEIPDLLAKSFMMCRADRHFTVDNLNHDVFTIFY